MINGISIIICCYNSVSRIEETLQHAFALTLPKDFLYEIILVDNNSSDTTRVVALEANRKFNRREIEFIVVVEPQQGLTFARKKGLEVSKYELILFCDDDNHLDINYLVEGKKLFEENSKLGIAGGWCKPKLAQSSGRWIEDFYGALAIEKHPKKSGRVNWVFGAGMILKKTIFAELKKERIEFLLTDRMGKQLTSGGDTEMCLLATFIGYDVTYSHRLQLHHCIATNRLSRRYFFITAHQNFYPVMHLFLLEKLVRRTGQTTVMMYFELFFERVVRIFYFLPRCVVGRHRFYSFISVYGNVLFAGWLCFQWFNFSRTAALIKSNLFHE